MKVRKTKNKVLNKMYDVLKKGLYKIHNTINYSDKRGLVIIFILAIVQNILRND